VGLKVTEKVQEPPGSITRPLHSVVVVNGASAAVTDTTVMDCPLMLSSSTGNVADWPGRIVLKVIVEPATNWGPRITVLLTADAVVCVSGGGEVPGAVGVCARLLFPAVPVPSPAVLVPLPAASAVLPPVAAVGGPFGPPHPGTMTMASRAAAAISGFAIAFIGFTPQV
jgi:uncharacterized Zn-binding protein involved in type VI secretion